MKPLTYHTKPIHEWSHTDFLEHIADTMKLEVCLHTQRNTVSELLVLRAMWSAQRGQTVEYLIYHNINMNL